MDITGDVVSAWLFDPDGTVLEGPNGPVSHLICGGVYDWSTGLIYRGGRYFDPNSGIASMPGIWLALMPLMVVQGWRKRLLSCFKYADLVVTRFVLQQERLPQSAQRSLSFLRCRQRRFLCVLSAFSATSAVKKRGTAQLLWILMQSDDRTEGDFVFTRTAMQGLSVAATGRGPARSAWHIGPSTRRENASSSASRAPAWSATRIWDRRRSASSAPCARMPRP